MNATNQPAPASLVDPNSLPGEDSAVASQAIASHNKLGGSTFDPRTGENLFGSRAWSFPAVPEAKKALLHAPTPDDYSAFVRENRDILSAHPNSAVQTHYDPETNLHHLDIAAISSSKNKSLEQASSVGAPAIHHLGRAESVPTGATPPEIHSSFPEDRFNELRSAEPAKQPYIGTHYSNSNLSYIDGSKRGLPDEKTGAGAGAESARLSLGDSTSAGVNAPPGFYVYDKDSRPHPSMQARKFANDVVGRFSFADISHEPIWANALAAGHESALATGAKPEDAAGLALNSAEHALRDHGFDGYYSSAQPGTRFIFDSHKASKQGEIPKFEAAKTSGTSGTPGMPNMLANQPAPAPNAQQTSQVTPASVTPKDVSKSAPAPAKKLTDDSADPASLHSPVESEQSELHSYLSAAQKRLKFLRSLPV